MRLRLVETLCGRDRRRRRRSAVHPEEDGERHPRQPQGVSLGGAATSATLQEGGFTKARQRHDTTRITHNHTKQTLEERTRHNPHNSQPHENNIGGEQVNERHDTRTQVHIAYNSPHGTGVWEGDLALRKGYHSTAVFTTGRGLGFIIARTG